MADRTSWRERAAPRAWPRDGSAQTPDAGRQAPAPQIARNILLLLLCSYVFAGVINIPADNPGDQQANTGSYVCMAIVFALTLAHIAPRAPFRPLWLRLLTLSAQAAATYLPFALYHELWGGMAGFLAGSFIILLRAPASWILFALCTASIAAVADATHETTPWVAYFAVSTANAGLVLYGLTKLADLVKLLHAARAELARLAVAQERLRFAQDLHDLLGYSLSSITLKSELAYRLADGQPEHARQELASILEVSRQALCDLRTVASSYRTMRFADELASVESMLLATGVDVSVEVSLPDLPPALDTVLATVLREGVTNMLRHSKVEHCSIVGRIADGRVRLELVNDGVNAERERDTPDPAGSSGLGSLTQRLATVGGALEAGMSAHDRFRLVARAPLRHAGAGTERAKSDAASDAGPQFEHAKPPEDSGSLEGVVNSPHPSGGRAPDE
ncbi:MAG: sensor histidine kinase [Actinocrinis sp.]